MAADSGGSNEPLQLEPFIHQVGGHSSMLQLDKDTICKPLIPRELNFYKSAPDSLKEFMAEFKGILEVTFSEALDGYIDLTTYLPPTYKLSPSKTARKSSFSDNEKKYKHRIKLCQSGDIEIESLTYDDVKQTFEKCNNSKSQNGTLLNPWVLRCHKEQMKKLRNSSSKILQKYIMLENRVSKFEFPCILDLKMGTRQYGDDASLAKRHSHTAKAASSTTAVLGVRINGMQVYHQDSGRFMCHNKYYGRSLNYRWISQNFGEFLTRRYSSAI
ncbi:inositol hexakisphosphate kinase 1-like [Uloborus diversus]|uniref:inositol hexakisphosphate kinase 1-like n=1 Tax=Uloborus diversus TaxID=327109 RepID=UPI0024092A39|nr:inositol hexakisphosphate kinase 1-like [Uloborus diversus]